MKAKATKKNYTKTIMIMVFPYVVLGVLLWRIHVERLMEYLVGKDAYFMGSYFFAWASRAGGLPLRFTC